MLTRVIAAAVAASACGGLVHADGAASGSGGDGSGGDVASDSGLDSTIGDAAAGDDVTVSCVFSPDGIPDPGGDCGVVLAEVVDAGRPGFDPGAVSNANCWDFTYRPNAACCGAQVVSRYACQYCDNGMLGEATCAMRVTDPCVSDVSEAADACAGWCAATEPANGLFGPLPICSLEPWDGSGPIVGDCIPDGPGCAGNGRPPRSFRPRRTRGPTRTAEQLALAAQLEAASVCAFQVLARDLERFGAPRLLIASARRAARDETRHARAMRRAAKRRGCNPPRVQAKAGAATSLLELALRNAEEGCVRETFGAAVALLQARTARDPALRQTMRRIAGDELRHAALSWRLQEWFLSRLRPAERDRLGDVRRRALEELDEELARGATANADLGLPGPLALRGLLRAMGTHLS